MADVIRGVEMFRKVNVPVSFYFIGFKKERKEQTNKQTIFFFSDFGIGWKYVLLYLSEM